MDSYLSMEIAQRHREMIAAADRHRLAAAAASPAALRRRVGRRLVRIGDHLAGNDRLIHRTSDC